MDYEDHIVTDDYVWSLLYLQDYSNGQTIISGHSNGHMYLWNIENNIKLRSYKEHISVVFDIKAAPTYKGKDSQPHKMFLSCSKDATIKLWNAEKSHSIKTFISDVSIFCIDILDNFNDKYFITGDKNSNLKIWNMFCDKNNESSRKTYELVDIISTGHEKEVWRLLHLKQIRPFDLVLTASNPNIRLINLNESKCVKTFSGHTSLIHSLVYLSKRKFASSSADFTIKIWSLDQDKCLKTLYMHEDKVYSLIHFTSFLEINNNENDIIISGGADKKINLIDFLIDKISDLNEENLISTYEKRESIYKMEYLQFSHKFRIAAINYGCSNKIYLWGKGKY